MPGEEILAGEVRQVKICPGKYGLAKYKTILQLKSPEL